MTPPSLEQVAWPVRTERLLLRRAEPRDAAATYVFRRHPCVQEWVTTAPGTEQEWAVLFTEPTRLGSTILVLERDVVVGDLMLRLERIWSQSEVPEADRGWQAEIGWSLDPAHAGRGLATEAVRGLLAICFDTLAVHRVVAHCFTDNERSWRLMERIGMRREAHTLKDSLHRSRGWLDAYGYAMLREEWPVRG